MKSGMKKLSKVLVETSWVAEHLEDPKVKVIEITGLFVPFNYHGHIPGSIVLDWRKALWHPVKREFVSKTEFERLMGRSGISKDTTVVFCSLAGQFSTYAFWVFKYYRHEDVRILNGGLSKWMMENLPLNKESTRLSDTPVTNYKAGNLGNIRVSRDHVLNVLQRKNVILVDARSSQEYRGELINAPGLAQEGAYCAGHIPGAVSIPAEDNIQPNGKFKAEEELQQLYRSHGVKPEKDVITYCRTGHRGSFAWFVLSYLLCYPKVRLYDGSWTEWGNLTSVPIEI